MLTSQDSQLWKLGWWNESGRNQMTWIGQWFLGCKKIVRGPTWLRGHAGCEAHVGRSAGRIGWKLCCRGRSEPKRRLDGGGKGGGDTQESGDVRNPTRQRRAAGRRLPFLRLEAGAGPQGRAGRAERWWCRASRWSSSRQVLEVQSIAAETGSANSQLTVQEGERGQSGKRSRTVTAVCVSFGG